MYVQFSFQKLRFQGWANRTKTKQKTDVYTYVCMYSNTTVAAKPDTTTRQYTLPESAPKHAAAELELCNSLVIAKARHTCTRGTTRRLPTSPSRNHDIVGMIGYLRELDRVTTQYITTILTKRSKQRKHGIESRSLFMPVAFIENGGKSYFVLKVV